MAKSKFQQLIERKLKIEEELAKEVDKRLMQIGRLAKNADLLEWSDDALKALFKEAKNKSEPYFLSLEEKPKETKIENPLQESSAL